MSIPSNRRSVPSILNNLIGRVRVLEALTASSARGGFASFFGGSESIPDSTDTAVPVDGSGSFTGDYFEAPAGAKMSIGVKFPGMYMARAFVNINSAAVFNRDLYCVADTSDPPVFNIDYWGFTLGDVELPTSRTMCWTGYFDLTTATQFPVYIGMYLRQESGGSLTASTPNLFVLRVGEASY